MKKNLLLLILIVFTNIPLFAQSSSYCLQSLFSNVEYYNQIALTQQNDVVYGSALDYLGNSTTLKMDIAYPNVLIDPLPKRPLVVLIHGGDFLTGSKTDLSTYAISLAKKGYVAATVDYRLGWDSGSTVCTGNVSQYQYASYRALQDVHAAIRYLVSNASNYRIDTNFIFIYGKDAGAMTALNVSFLNQAEADNAFPFASADLGKIDSATNTFYNHFKVKAIANYCGGILDTNAIQNTDATKVLSIHGNLDTVISINVGHYNNCANFPIVFGPKSIHQRMVNVGLCDEGNYDANGLHCALPYLEEVNYIPEKMVCFFKKILCGVCNATEVVGYNSQTCSDQAPLLTSTATKIDGIHIFPNPVNNQLGIKINQIIHEQLSIEIVNLQGQVVQNCFNQAISQDQFSTTIELNKNVNAGIYFVKITIDNTTHYQKIEIE